MNKAGYLLRLLRSGPYADAGNGNRTVYKQGYAGKGNKPYRFGSCQSHDIRFNSDISVLYI